jgi:DUF917 family protein
MTLAELVPISQGQGYLIQRNLILEMIMRAVKTNIHKGRKIPEARKTHEEGVEEVLHRNRTQIIINKMTKMKKKNLKRNMNLSTK